MKIRQLSIFLENREGRLEEVLQILGDNKVSIVALSLADTSDYGVLRMIVSAPEVAQKVLKEHDISAKLVEVIALRVPHEAGSLSRAMCKLADANINVEYMYAFANGDDASAILKTREPEKAAQILISGGFDVWQEEAAYKANE